MSADLQIKELQDKIIELEDELESAKRIDTYGNQSTITAIKNDIERNQGHIDFIRLMETFKE